MLRVGRRVDRPRRCLRRRRRRRDERVWEASERESDGFIAVRGAEHADGPVAGCGRGERVDRSFGHDDLGVSALGGAHPGELGVGGEVGSRVEVTGPVGIGVGHADLGVDGSAVGDGRQHSSEGSGPSVRAVLVAGAEIEPDAVLGEDIGGNGADVGEPPSDRSSFRLPQPLGALVDVTLEAFGVPTAGRRRAECGRQRTGGLPVGSLVVVPGSIHEELEGVAHGAALASENEVDGRRRRRSRGNASVGRLGGHGRC